MSTAAGRMLYETGVLPQVARFTPLDRRDRPWHGRICAIDTEGSADTARFTATAQWDDAYGDTHFERFTEPWDFAEFLIEQARAPLPVLIYAHNLEWDLQVIFSWMRDHLIYVKHTARRNGSALVATFDYPGRHGRQRMIQIRDSLAIWPLSLAKLGQIVGLPKYRTPRAYIPNMVNWRTGAIIESPAEEDDNAPNCEHGLAECAKCYDLRDVAILHRAMRLYIEECDADGVKPSLTRSAHAMRDFRTNYLGHGLIQYTERENLRAQVARHGGRSQCMKPGLTVCEPGEVIVTADVVSEYPTVMRQGRFPDARHHVVMHHPRTDRVREYIGFAWADVRVPAMPLGPLLYCDPRDGRISYPSDCRIQSAWTCEELAYAMDLGCDVTVTRLEGCHERYALDPFSHYIDDKFAQRLAAKRDGNPLHEAKKLTMNGLSGKFGMRWTEPMLEFRAVREDDVRDTVAMLTDDPCVRADRMPSRYPDYVMIPWSAQIMARGRMLLHRFALRLLDELGAELLQCDTDSWVFRCDRALLESRGDLFGSTLGRWELEKREDGGTYWHAFRAAAPKEYALYADETELFTHHPSKARAKGIGAVAGGEKYEAIDHYLRTGNVHFQRPQKMRSVLRGAAMATFVHVEKTRHAWMTAPLPLIFDDWNAEVRRQVEHAHRGTLYMVRNPDAKCEPFIASDTPWVSAEEIAAAPF